MPKQTFAGRFISKIDKIDPKQIEGFITQLNQERDFFKVILNSLRDGIIVTDSDLNVLFLNDSATNLLALVSRKKFIGEKIYKINRQRNLSDAIFKYDINSHKPQDIEVSINVPSKRLYSLRIMPVMGDNEEVNSLVFIIADITEEKKREQDKIKEDKITSLATLVAGIAHEIKNPLNSLNIHAQLIKRNIKETNKKEESSRIKQSVEIVLEETERLGRIVDQFIQAVRPTSADFRLGDINNVIRKVTQALQPEIEEKKINFYLSLESDLPRVYFDDQQMFQALRNVLKNSIEAIKEGLPGKIEIHSYTKQEKVCIDLSDNGCGIEERNITKIFEPYYTTKFGGSGLGLMNVYRVVKEHNGEISIVSELEKGTTFTITLPIAKKRVKLLPERKLKKNK